MAQKVEPGTAVHLPHDPLRAGVNALGPAVAVREGESGVHGVAVEFEAVGEAVQVGQISGSDASTARSRRTCAWAVPAQAWPRCGRRRPRRGWTK